MDARRGAKRPRSAELSLATPIISVNDLQAACIPLSSLLADGNSSLTGAKKLRNAAHHSLQMQLRINTPYGPMGRNLVIERGGETLVIDYADPFAYFSHLCEVSPAFGTFLMSHLRSGLGSIAIYHDEAKPGNALRPDAARSFVAIYWTVSEWPDWFRNRCATGWVVLGYVHYAQMQRVVIELGEVGQHIWKTNGDKQGMGSRALGKQVMLIPFAFLNVLGLEAKFSL